MTTCGNQPSDPAAAQAEKILARTAATWAKLAESQAPTLIGSTALEVLSQTGEISVNAIIAALRAKADDAPSNRGKGAARLDIALLTAEAAIRQMEALLPAT